MGWVVAVSREDAQLLEALAHEGISPLAGQTPRAGPGAVLLSGDPDRDCEGLRLYSREGRDRILALVPHERSAAPLSCWQYLAAGASDVVTWGAGCAPLIAARLRRWSEIDGLLDSPLIREHLVGESTPWRAAVRELIELARYASSSVLVLGETGTGKELFARVVHALDPRPQKRELVVLDCSTIVPELSGSEFFGHERGAYTGAVGPRDGAFELARGGTLFLDEVGELPLPLQAQLLRVIQERTYKRVGGSSWQQTDFRLICATHRDLGAEVAAGRFRHDLFHRIASATCRIPPLRERSGDVLPLVRHFLAAARPGRQALELDPTVRDFLLTRDYPGNVRELRQLVIRIAERHVGDGPITAGAIPLADRPAAAPARATGDVMEAAIRQALTHGAGLKEIGRAATDAAIRMVVADEAGNLQRAARRLGVTDRALQLRRKTGDTQE